MALELAAGNERMETGVPGGYAIGDVLGPEKNRRAHVASTEGQVAADGTPDDITYFMRWTEAADGWVTSAGVNTTLADEEPEVAAAAYPDAEVLRFEWGSIWQITD